MSVPTSGSQGRDKGEDQLALLDNGRSGSALEGNWREHFPDIIGHSPVLLRVLETVAKVARSDSAILISGPSGTGKELIAAAVHRLSTRSSRRFVAINCSAIPEDLLESELFGHEKGAFTGADRRRQGLFETAEGGTVFLDEIGDMSMRLQAKLLRVLQERKFSPVGSNELKKSDVRIIAATNLDLQKAVESQKFRLDLFYRLNVIPVHLAPLRERIDDVPLLLRHFLEIANRVHAVASPCHFDEGAMAALSQYGWPGNIRELQNLVERMVIMTGGGTITHEVLPEEYREHVAAAESSSAPGASTIQRGGAVAGMLRSSTNSSITYPQDFGALPHAGIDLPQFIESLENNLIRQALERTQNNKNQAARLLGLNRTTLVERIKKRKLGPVNDVNDQDEF